MCGKCSLCGGTVSVPTMWMGIYPPVPTCQSCAATDARFSPDGKREIELPVIPMRHPDGQGRPKPSLWDILIGTKGPREPR